MNLSNQCVQEYDGSREPIELNYDELRQNMAFRSGQCYMNFINTLKLFTANIKSFDMKSNCTNLSSSFKI